MPSLNVFEQDAFGVISLTDSVNAIPFTPGRAGQAIQWNERGVTTTTIMIESVDGTLQLLNPSARGGHGTTKTKDKRSARALIVPHYQYDDAINADEVQGVRAFGSETEVQSVMGLVNQRLSDAVLGFARVQQRDPAEVLDASFEALQALVNTRVLVPSDAADAAGTRRCIRSWLDAIRSSAVSRRKTDEHG